MTVYLIHFHSKLHHAQHYLGWTNDLERRVQEHRDGAGSRLMEVARVWPEGDRDLERRLKRWHKARTLCPICKAETKQRGNV